MSIEFEINSDEWGTSKMQIGAHQVASIDFNEAAQTTEITVKPNETVIAYMGFWFETDEVGGPVPVKGTVEETKLAFGL